MLHLYDGAMDHLHARPPRGDGGTADAAARDADPGESLRYDALRFPGCRRISLSRAEFEDFDDRIEYWDARTETAWVVADKYGVHEGTSRRLPHLAERIASVRGTPIVSYGSVTLLVRDEAGEPRRAMEADETLYLRLRVDPIKERPRLGRRQHRRRPFDHHVLRSPHRRGRIHRQHLVDDEPVAQHPDGGQVLFHRRRRARMRADIGSHVKRGDRAQAQAPSRTPPDCLREGARSYGKGLHVERRPARGHRYSPVRLMCSHPSGETWTRKFGQDVEAGVLPGEDGLAELQRVPVDDDRGQQVEAGDTCPPAA